MNLSDVSSKSLSDFQKPGGVKLWQAFYAYAVSVILLGTVKDKVVGEVDALPTLFVPALLLSK